MPGLDRWTMDALGKALLDDEGTPRGPTGDAMLVIVLLIIAAVCFAIEAFLHRSILAAGLLAWVLVALLPRVL